MTYCYILFNNNATTEIYTLSLHDALPISDLEALRVELQRTADIPDPTEQMLEIAGVVDAALRPIEIRPVVVGGLAVAYWTTRSEEHTSELQSPVHLVCRLLLEKKKQISHI